MKISRRQTVLLFELISSKKPLSYAFFQNYFGVCRRTIHEDVKRVNDVLGERYSIKIHYQNGRGFSLEYSSEESLDLLKNELRTYRFGMSFFSVLIISLTFENACLIV